MSQVAEPRFPFPSLWGRGAAINRRTRPLLGELHPETQRLSLGLCEGPRMRREMRWGRCWDRRPQGLSYHPPSPPPTVLRPGPGSAAPYAGGGRSAGGRCRSRARGGTGSSQSGPEARIPSAPPLCGAQPQRDERGLLGRPHPRQPPQRWVPTLTSQGPVSRLICKMGSQGRRGALSD